jgi:branched-chain amino acid transport system ATP-binding protein
VPRAAGLPELRADADDVGVPTDRPADRRGGLARDRSRERTPATQGGTPPLLSVDGITVGYGAVIALRDVSLEVGRGEIVAALGPNGAGKTTLLRTLAGALRPKRGSVAFDEATLTGLAPEAVVRRGVALVPEGRRVFPALTVEENLAIGGIARQDRDALRADTDRWLGRFPILGERVHQLAGTLSGGEQQQLAIARALMSRPRLLLLDEPSLGLAPIFVDRIFELIAELRSEGVTVLVVEQNVHRALEVADRAYVLSVGHVVASGATDQLIEGELERSYLGLGQAVLP